MLVITTVRLGSHRGSVTGNHHPAARPWRYSTTAVVLYRHGGGDGTTAVRPSRTTVIGHHRDFHLVNELLVLVVVLLRGGLLWSVCTGPL